MVNLIGFFPFKTAGDALSNINSVSEGIVSDDLKLFLETNMPKGKAVLGVSDSKLSASINDALGIKCSHIGVVPEVILSLVRFTNFNQHSSAGAPRNPAAFFKACEGVHRGNE